jgi:hypothetical protein
MFADGGHLQCANTSKRSKDQPSRSAVHLDAIR